MNNVDNYNYFASYENPNGSVSCSILRKAKCEGCKFYRNDINRKDIERDIEYYAKGRVSKKNEYRL